MEILDIVGAACGVTAALSGSYLIAAGFLTQSKRYLAFGLLTYILGLITIITILERIALS